MQVAQIAQGNIGVLMELLLNQPIKRIARTLKMKLLLAVAKLRNGPVSGTWRSLKIGELLSEGDLQFGMTFVCDIAEQHVGKPVVKGESFVRMEWER